MQFCWWLQFRRLGRRPSKLKGKDRKRWPKDWKRATHPKGKAGAAQRPKTVETAPQIGEENFRVQSDSKSHGLGSSAAAGGSCGRRCRFVTENGRLERRHQGEQCVQLGG